MSMPNIPDIRPDIELTREQVVHLLLASIAMEELGLAHILNAEGEKLQKAVADPQLSMEELLCVNEAVERTLRTLIRKELLLQMKLDAVMRMLPCEGAPECCGE
ncbi:hypothetical protein TC41_2807 [Alicyclobacillus acidocaldarius subsp. acidocaldarius Tc-4-1]|uniref:Uncharacterized protein n=2 Tax=Alicyclobacillus acidocaldarius TaxID=405212 RepID=F8IJI7_ALIAT|nr:hypothetical protein TC41_2807 [Alicyclobacillus acidocaldarius subsp. acidocaldarius Tc-4-1]